jgi:hypothetical protein
VIPRSDPKHQWRTPNPPVVMTFGSSVGRSPIPIAKTGSVETASCRRTVGKHERCVIFYVAQFHSFRPWGGKFAGIPERILDPDLSE